jgi:hypothetical protein
LVERARGCKAVVRLIIERDDVEADLKDKKNRTPLFWAVATAIRAFPMPAAVFSLNENVCLLDLSKKLKR